MKITNLAIIFSGKRWIFYVVGVVILGIVVTSIWYCKFYAPQREFDKSLTSLLKEYSLIVEDINNIYTDGTITIEDFREKSKEILKDLSDLEKTAITVDTPNDDAKEKIAIFTGALNLGIDAIGKGCDAMDAWFQYTEVREGRGEWASEGFDKFMKRLAEEGAEAYIISSMAELIKAGNKWKTLRDEWSEKVEEYRESHNVLLETAKQMKVDIPELQF